jgi:Na+/H+ antiporter NhaD/arsenite permease-like protein
MTSVILIIFLIGYLAIVFEEAIHINKTASALVTGILCWTATMVLTPDAALSLENYGSWSVLVESKLMHHIAEIASILFFLLGAMTIVELIDAHQGFRIITDIIKTKSTITLLWLIVVITFFLSSVLDNLTTAIVMITIVGRILNEKELRWWFGGAIIIASNAGGAWSPIGDVTTTMLWIGGQITPLNIIKMLIVPSLVSAVLPTLYIAWQLKRTKQTKLSPIKIEKDKPVKGRTLIFVVGILGLLFVPVFKTLTHLPPVLGILLSLGVIWAITEIVHKKADFEERKNLTAAHALSRIDSSSILFFLGILLAIGSLDTIGVLEHLALVLNKIVGNPEYIALIIGAASAVVDNVPLVAASMGMYDLTSFPTDHPFWELLAYAAGTGGSMLIIGSAPGVAIMGIEKMTFGWYLKKITIPALIGFVAGAMVYISVY